MRSRLLVIGAIVVVGVLAGLAAYGLWGRNQAVTTPSTSPLALATSTTAATTTTPTPGTTSAPATTSTLPAKGWLVIQGTGDVNLDTGYIPALAAEGWDHAWSGLDGLFLDDDLTVVNLECAPSDLGSPEPKEFVFRCPSEALPSLASNGVEVANLGNNHSGDYGKEALVDGRANLIASGVAPVGAGRDIDEAGAPATFEVEGWRIAVVGFGGVFPNDAWVASEDSAGMRNGDDIPSMVAAVEAAASQADLVVVAIHWGVEFDTTPPARRCGAGRGDDCSRSRYHLRASPASFAAARCRRRQTCLLVPGELRMAKYLACRLDYRGCPRCGFARWDNRRMPHPGPDREPRTSGAHRGTELRRANLRAC
ncbi:MAG: CapA family protein [Actinomycetota bacterium]|nr:CapA family protein [Actinomycetota bacterium]